MMIKIPSGLDLSGTQDGEKIEVKAEAIKQGEELKIVSVNGVSVEPTESEVESEDMSNERENLLKMAGNADQEEMES